MVLISSLHFIGTHCHAWLEPKMGRETRSKCGGCRGGRARRRCMFSGVDGGGEGEVRIQEQKGGGE